MQLPDKPRKSAFSTPPPHAGEQPPPPAQSPGRGPLPLDASADEKGPHRRRRRSSSRKSILEEYGKKPKKSQMFSTRLNQVALILSAILVLGLLVGSVYYFARPKVPPTLTTGRSVPLLSEAAGPAGAAADATPTAPLEKAVAARAEPQSEDTWDMVHGAFALFRQGKLEDAFAKFETAHRMAPGFPGLVFQMARVRMQQRQLDQAYRLASESIALGEEVSESYILRGQIEMAQGSYTPAYTSFESAITNDPHRPYAYFYWGEALRNEGRARQAITRLQQAYDRAFEQPDAFVIHLKLLLARAEAGDTELLKEELPTQLANPKSSGEWFIAAAAVALQENRVADAAGYLTTARERLQPNFYYFVVLDKFFDLHRTNAELSGLLNP